MSYKYVKDCWYVAGLSHEFKPSVLTSHKIAEQSLVLWRTPEGNVVAFDNRCCHKRFPISEGRFLQDGSLECAYHGLCYDDAGNYEDKAHYAADDDINWDTWWGEYIDGE